MTDPTREELEAWAKEKIPYAVERSKFALLALKLLGDRDAEKVRADALAVELEGVKAAYFEERERGDKAGAPQIDTSSPPTPERGK